MLLSRAKFPSAAAWLLSAWETKKFSLNWVLIENSIQIFLKCIENFDWFGWIVVGSNLGDITGRLIPPTTGPGG